MIETLLGEITVYCVAVALDGRRAGSVILLSDDHMPRPSSERVAVRKRIDGHDVLFVNSIKSKKHAYAGAKKAFQEWESGKHTFVLDELYALTDD